MALIVMLNLMVHWAISALSLVVVAYLIPGIRIDGLGPALIAPLVIGLVNATIGFILKIVTFPITILSLGIFLFVINALMLMFAASLVPGFAVAGFWSAFFGAIVMSLVSMLLRSLVT
jgi:putative membrane protein